MDGNEGKGENKGKGTGMNGTSGKTWKREIAELRKKK